MCNWPRLASAGLSGPTSWRPAVRSSPPTARLSTRARGGAAVGRCAVGADQRRRRLAAVAAHERPGVVAGVAAHIPTTQQALPRTKKDCYFLHSLSLHSILLRPDGTAGANSLQVAARTSGAPTQVLQNTSELPSTPGRPQCAQHGRTRRRKKTDGRKVTRASLTLSGRMR